MSKIDDLVFRLKTLSGLAVKHERKGDEKIYADAIEVIECFEDALRIIAGDMQAADNTLSNVAIAKLALKQATGG